MSRSPAGRHPLADPASAEETFVQQCLTRCIWPDRPALRPAQDLNWDRLFHLLLQHSLSGIFFIIGRQQPDLWPEALQQRLAREYYSAVLWGDACAQEASDVLAALSRSSIPLIVLKGWSRLDTVYAGDYGQRTSSDIDLLVPPEYAARAEDALLDMGYGAEPEARPGHIRRYGSRRSYQLGRDPGAFRSVFFVGVHWGLLDAPYHPQWIRIDEVFKRAVPTQVAGASVLRLASEDEIVYECAHLGLHHGYDEALYRYYEMAALLLKRGSALDWANVRARASEWRLVIPTQRVLGSLSSLWPEVIPAESLAALQALRPTRSEALVHWAVSGRENRAVRAVIDWLTLPTVVDRLRFPLEIAFPSRAFVVQKYGPAPGGVWPLLYLHRTGVALRQAVGWF